MIITSIAANKTPSSPTSTWKFEAGSINLSRSWLFYCSNDEAILLRTAISGILNSRPSKMHRVHLALVDDAGNRWELERKDGKFSCFFNNKGPIQTEISSVFDRIWKAGAKLISNSGTNYLKHHILHNLNSLETIDIQNHNRTNQDISFYLRNEINKKESLLKSFFGISQIPSEDKLVSFLKSLSKNIDKRDALESLLISLNKQLGLQTKDIQDHAEDEKLLTKKILILQEMEFLILLLDNQKNHGLENRTLLNSKNEQASTLKNLKISSSEWKNILHTVGELEFLEQQIHLLKEFNDNILGRLSDNYKLLVTAMEETYGSDNINPVSNTVRNLKAMQEMKKPKFSFLASKSSQKFQKDLEELLHALAHMNLVKNDFEQKKPIFSRIFEQLKAHNFEKLQKLKKLQLEWQNQAKVLSIDPKIPFSELLSYVEESTDFICRDKTTREVQRATLFTTNVQKRLKNVLREWFTLEKKSLPISLELNDILNLSRKASYQKSKLQKKLFSRLENEALRNAANTYNWIESQIRFLEKEWKKLFINNNIPILQVKPIGIRDVLEEGIAISKLKQTLRNSPSLATPVFSPSVIAPLQTWFIPKLKSEKQVSILKKTLERIYPSHLNIIFTNDKHLFLNLNQSKLGLISHEIKEVTTIASNVNYRSNRPMSQKENLTSVENSSSKTTKELTSLVNLLNGNRP